MVEHERGTDTSGDGSDANITKGIVAFLKARDVHINSGAAGFVAAQGNFSISNGGAGPVFANGDVKIRYGGCGPVFASGDFSIVNGGCGPVIANARATIGSQARVGMLVSPNVIVEEGGQVLLGFREAIALGVTAGIAFALASRLLRR